MGSVSKRFLKTHRLEVFKNLSQMLQSNVTEDVEMALTTIMIRRSCIVKTFMAPKMSQAIAGPTEGAMSA